MNRLKTIAAALILIPLVACAQRNDSIDEEIKTLYKHTVPVVSKIDAEAWKTAKILDTREPYEFEVSHLPGAQLVGYDDFKLNTVQSIAKTDTIIVYCSIGYRSERIGEKLQKAGYKHVFNLYGGIFNWKNQNGVVVDSKNRTTQNVHTYNEKWARFLKNGNKVF